jgi:hypothetical protein
LYGLLQADVLVPCYLWVAAWSGRASECCKARSHNVTIGRISIESDGSQGIVDGLLLARICMGIEIGQVKFIVR